MRLSRPPPLRNLRAFCAAARHRSFKAAADELFLTPSAVSHQMKELEAALGACDAAVRQARNERANLPSWMEWARGRHDDYVAVAYANRAVMHWLAKDASAAQLDLAKAEALSPKADFVARNLEALRTRNALAQVAAGPQS